jgi:HlyD family secretion protein
LIPLTEVKLSSEVSGEVIELNVKEGDSVKQGQLLAIINPSIYESLVTQAEAALNQIRASRSSAKASSIQAKAQYNQALVTYNRNKTLHTQKVISDAELEAAKLQLEQADAGLKTAEEQVNGASFNISSAEAQVKQAKENLLRTKIYAPIGGIVSLVNVKLGERVVGTAQMSGTEIIRLADLENMLIQVVISSRNERNCRY